MAVREVLPSVTDQAVGQPDSPHVVMVGSPSRWNGKLFVFLPGTQGSPTENLLLLATAARMGFHVVGLSYPNSPSVGVRCLNNLGCYGKIRQNVFNGTDPSPLSAIPPVNAVEHRLVALLSYLTRTHPRQGWGGFVSQEAPVFPSIVFAGHSQGGGEAAFIAKIREVSGVVMLSSAVDSTTGQPPVPATWVTSGHLTPASRYAGLDHTADPFYPKIRADWTGLGLDRLGPAVSVDKSSPPYGQSHELVTSVAVPPVPLAAHDSTAVDNAAPLCPDGTPELVPVWRDMMMIALGGRPHQGPAACSMKRGP